MMARLDRSGSLAGLEAVRAWREVAGAEVSAHAVGSALRDRELVVFVDSPVWAQELAALSGIYVERVNAALGKEMVGSIRFAVSRKAEQALREEPAPDDAKEPRVVPVPLSDLERRQLDQMTGTIHDERLREAVLGAATLHLEWQKGMRSRKTAQGAGDRPTEPDPRSEH
jgi:hypothetical protein